jgi:hypothetical protein
VIFVEQHSSDAGKFRIARDHALENALGDDFDPRLRADLRIEPHPVTDSLANLLAKQLRHAASRGARGQPARFQHDDLPPVEPGFVEKRQRHQRRLAGAGWRDEHRVRRPTPARFSSPRISTTGRSGSLIAASADLDHAPPAAFASVASWVTRITGKRLRRA